MHTHVRAYDDWTTLILTMPTTSMHDNHLTPPQLRAVNAYGPSDWSDLSPPLMTATAPPEPPPAPRIGQVLSPVAVEVGGVCVCVCVCVCVSE
jgi:hypothetical protein